MNAVEKYLARYAEPETLLLDGFPGGFSHGLVIPAYREDSEFINRLADFSRANAGTLVILIVNRPDLLSAENALQEESISAQWAEEIFTELNQYEITWSANNSQLSLYSIASDSGVLTVDRCLIGSAIPGDQGVGLARKIGNDVLCSLIHSKNVKSPWMANTDADVRLPLNYFSAQTLERSSCSAILYPFKHIFVDEIPKLPTLLYEYSLNYYVAGLSWAGSPYAYHTVGSTLAVNFQHYCQVRGFPKRPAAEDFYLLNKLAKTGSIMAVKEPSIEIQARESTRVPFGTGPGVRKIGNLSKPLTMQLYHPGSFAYLHFFLQLLRRLSIQRSSVSEACNTLNLESQPYVDLIEPEDKPHLTNTLCHIAKRLKLDIAVDNCYKNNSSPEQRLKHLTGWFDGFKTLKFIHHIRDHLLNTVSFEQLMCEFQKSTPFLDSNELTIGREKIATHT